MEHGARKHDKYSGSNAHRFSLCSGQVALAEKIGVEISSVDADKGTAAHELLESTLKHQEFVVTDDATFKSVQHVLDYIEGLRRQYPDLIVKSETYVNFPQNFCREPNFAGGLVDVICCSPSAGIYWIIDFKNGVGETVTVHGNMQMLFYGTAALWNITFSRAFLVIIQPNSFMGSEPREIEVTALDLIEFQADIENAIILAEGRAAMLVPGDHCHRCPAGVGCLARERQAIASLTGDMSTIREFDTRSLPLPSDLPLDRLGQILKAEEFAKQWFSDARAYATQEGMRGVHIPGHKIVEANARRKWRPDYTPERIAEALTYGTGSLLDLDNVMPRKLIAMTTAEDLFVEVFRNNAPLEGKSAAVAEAKARFAQLTLKDSNGSVTLVADTDPRPVANRSRNDFAGVVPAEAVTQSTVPLGFMAAFGGQG